MGQGLLVDGAQSVQRGIGVGVGLEVSEELLRFPVADPVELYTLVYLFVDRDAGSAVTGMEGGIVAVGATARTGPTVAVGAGEAGVHHDFLQPLTVSLLEISYVRVVSAHGSPLQTDFEDSLTYSTGAHERCMAVLGEADDEVVV